MPKRADVGTVSAPAAKPRFSILHPLLNQGLALSPTKTIGRVRAVRVSLPIWAVRTVTISTSKGSGRGSGHHQNRPWARLCICKPDHLGGAADAEHDIQWQ